MAPKMRPNFPKWDPWGDPGGIFGSLGCQNGSWRGKLAPRWGKLGPTCAKIGQVGAKLGTNGVKLGPSWRQDASRRDPKDAKWRSQGAFWNIFGPLGCKNAGLLEYYRFLHENEGPDGVLGRLPDHYWFLWVQKNMITDDKVRLNSTKKDKI